MAALLVGAGALAFDQIKKTKEKRAARRAHNDARYTDLEKETEARLSSSTTAKCSCESPFWPGGDCPTHGYVPAASSSSPHGAATGGAAVPAYSEPTSPSRPGFNPKRAPSYSDVTSFHPGMAAPSQPRQQSQQRTTSSASGNFVQISSAGSTTTVTSGGGEAAGTRGRRPSNRSQSSGNFVSISSGGGQKRGNSNFNAFYDSVKVEGKRGGDVVEVAGGGDEEVKRGKERNGKKAGKGSWWRRKGRGGAGEGDGLEGGSSDGIVR